jgi:histidine triad (HIT) family protein
MKIVTCVFCEIIAGACPSHILHRDERVIAFLSLEGHPLVAPLGHLPALEGLDDETAVAIFQCAIKIARAVRLATGCHGVNLVLSDGRAAGQDVFHMHLHVKPRWEGDDVRLTWNTTTVLDAERAALANAIRTYLPMQSSV